tara:strand:+ start:1484 stop:1960 length:477 start_codon:yes stop_codon:yes gene_type:complete
MIQRIQSVYLFLAIIFYLTYWFFGLEWYQSGFKILTEKLDDDIVINSPILDLILNITSYIPTLIAILCTVSIYSYKSRIKQILISKISLYLSLFMSFYSLIYFYFALEGLSEIMPSKFLEILLYLAIVNPLICTYLIYLAIKSIRKDNELVESLNRIR